MADVLYHYTNESGFEKIIKNPEKFVNDAQKFSRTRSIKEDPDYKVGFYFTDITPQNNTWKQIAQALFEDDSESSMRKCEYFIVIQHWGNVKQFERNTRFYILPESTTTKQKFVMGGRTDTYAIPEDERHRVEIGKPYLTVYEKARIIGSRALQLSHGAPPLIDIQENKDLIELAQLELKTRVLPIGIERKLPNGKEQTIPIQWLSDKDFIQQINVSDEIKAFREIIHDESIVITAPSEEKVKEPVTSKKPKAKSVSKKKSAKNNTFVLKLELDKTDLKKISEIADWKGAISLDKSSIKNSGLRLLKRKKVILTDDLIAVQKYCEKKVELDFPIEQMTFPSETISLSDLTKEIGSDFSPCLSFDTYYTVDAITILGNVPAVIFSKKKPAYIIIPSIMKKLKVAIPVESEFKGYFNYFALNEMGFNTKDLKIAFVNSSSKDIDLNAVTAYLRGDKTAIDKHDLKISVQGMTEKRSADFQKTLKDLISYWKKERTLKKQSSKKRCEACEHASTCELSLATKKE